ncbi:hypothetical protein ABH933_001223 [Nocardia sp. GP40]|uniref:DUF2786 domain-containing protein n=1 Tax=Nocardia sp. GP40 TaxID=3156268 RepID=UPI003D23E6C7
MATERTRETMSDRIGALLNRADNATTPEEADACRDKAFALLAKHGITESEARGTLREGNNVIMKLTFRLQGQYLNQQRFLLTQVAQALHCTSVMYGNSRRGIKVIVFGVKIHTERVQLLTAMLNPRMMAAAARQKPPAGYRNSTRAYRVDWMLGYATSISARLAAAEHTAAADRDAEIGTTTQALVLVSDLDRATSARDAAYPQLGKNSYRRDITATPYYQGRLAGEQADLAEHGQLRNRREIGR